MKIKCPACAKVLNIPETSAGKVVQCPCGKKLRAPGGAAKPAAAQTGQAARPTPAARQAPVQATPTAAAGAMEFDPAMFDELTEQDLQPVRAVNRPGGAPAQAAAATSGKKKDILAKARVDAQRETEAEKQGYRQGARKELLQSIGLLVGLGLLEFIINIIFFLAVPEEFAELGGEDGDILLTLLRVFYGIKITLGGLFLVCGALIFKFPMICAWTAIGTFIITEIVSLLVNPFRLISIRGWIWRAAKFGGLLQTINNASYYKFVKSGGRDKS